jgi:hypothetical protein
MTAWRRGSVALGGATVASEMAQALYAGAVLV